MISVERARLNSTDGLEEKKEDKRHCKFGLRQLKNGPFYGLAAKLGRVRREIRRRHAQPNTVGVKGRIASAGTDAEICKCMCQGLDPRARAHLDRSAIQARFRSQKEGSEGVIGL